MYVGSLSVEEVKRSKIEDKMEIVAMFDEASAFMLWHAWCTKLDEITFRAGFAHVGVFFVSASTKKGQMDYWVVVGDLPPLYLDTDGGRVNSPSIALEDYTYVMEIWVEAASGIEADGPIPPVLTRRTLQQIAPTEEYATMLGRRMIFIREKIVPLMR